MASAMHERVAATTSNANQLTRASSSSDLPTQPRPALLRSSSSLASLLATTTTSNVVGANERTSPATANTSKPPKAPAASNSANSFDDINTTSGRNSRASTSSASLVGSAKPPLMPQQSRSARVASTLSNQSASQSVKTAPATNKVKSQGINGKEEHSQARPPKPPPVVTRTATNTNSDVEQPTASTNENRYRKQKSSSRDRSQSRRQRKASEMVQDDQADRERRRERLNSDLDHRDPIERESDSNDAIKTKRDRKRSDQSATNDKTSNADTGRPRRRNSNASNTRSSRSRKEKRQKETPKPEMHPLFAHISRNPADFDGCITAIRITRTDSLMDDMRLRHPLVQIHIVDEATGQYIPKSDTKRPVTTFHEPEHVDFVLPAITRPFDLVAHGTHTPVWDETIVFNEEYLHIVRPGVLVLFEVLDIMSGFKSIRKNTDGWHRIAWGFLKLVGAHGQANTEQPLRLQLFKYPWWLRQGHMVGRVPSVYACYRRGGSRCARYPSTLHIEVAAHGRVEPRKVVGRPERPNERETGRLSYDQMLRMYCAKRRTGDAVMRSLLSLHALDYDWRRRDGQPCKIPNRPSLRIAAGECGAFACAFSDSGLVLAIACANRGTHPIRLYDVLSGDRVGVLHGHIDLVYQLLWMNNDTELVSVSADGSARVWRFYGDGSSREVAVLQHPTFVYTACIRPHVASGNAKTSPITTHAKAESGSYHGPIVIATGAYDGIIRLWCHAPDAATDSSSRSLLSTHRDDNTRPIAKLTGHSTHVNALAFDTDGRRLYSADGHGIIKIWSLRTQASSDIDIDSFDYDCIKTIDTLSGTPIHRLIMHISGRRLVVQTPHSIHTIDTRIFRFLTHVKMPEHVVSSSGLPFIGYLPRDDKTDQAIKMGSGTKDGHVYRAPVHISPAHRSSQTFTRACVTPCGTFVMCGSAHGQVHVWRVETGQLVASYTSGHLDGWDDNQHAGCHAERAGAPIVAMAFHPKDHMVCFVRWGNSEPACVWTWDESVPPVGTDSTTAAASASADNETKEDAGQGKAAALGYFDVDTIVAKSLASRLNLADSREHAAEDSLPNQATSEMVAKNGHRRVSIGGANGARIEPQLPRRKQLAQMVAQGRDADIG